PTEADGVVWASWHDAVAAQPNVVDPPDRVGDAVGSAETKEQSDAAVGMTFGTLKILIEVVVDRPRVARAVEGHNRNEQLGEKAFDDPPKHRRRVVEPIEFQLQESPRNVGGILLERDAALVAPSEPDELMPHEAEWLDGDPAFGAHQYAIAKC